MGEWRRRWPAGVARGWRMSSRFGARIRGMRARCGAMGSTRPRVRCHLSRPSLCTDGMRMFSCPPTERACHRRRTSTPSMLPPIPTTSRPGLSLIISCSPRWCRLSPTTCRPSPSTTRPSPTPYRPKSRLTNSRCRPRRLPCTPPRCLPRAPVCYRHVAAGNGCTTGAPGIETITRITNSGVGSSHADVAAGVA